MHNLKIFAKTIEPEALEQINLLLSQAAFKDCKVRIMPDTHAGKGCVIGFTADLGDKVIPNIVGVDIGCGMQTIYLKQQEVDFQALDAIIRQYVPFGRNVHADRISEFPLLKELKCLKGLKDVKRLECSIGSLGGGNHFIEVDVDNEQNKYLVIHTGSRNLGKQVAEHYQNLAFDLMKGEEKFIAEQNDIFKEYVAAGKQKDIPKAISDLKKKHKKCLAEISKDLCFLTGEHRENYLHDMKICQAYAEANRQAISDIILNGLNLHSFGGFQTIHNYIDHTNNIVRKGAISANKDELVLIPINMRDGCILGKGRGNVDWNFSAPHGAGRLMSRTKAKAELSMDEYKSSMSNIFSSSVCADTLDEAPMAYKPMDEIIDCIDQTVDILKILKPVYNFKASE